MNHDDLYPPSPARVPDDLTAPSLRYRLQIAGVLVATALFFALYVALVVMAARVFLHALHLDVEIRGLWSLLFRVMGVFIPAMFLVFLVKPLFKRQRRDVSALLEVTEREEPALFAFLRRLCHETGAPMPLHVYVTHEVNAAVFYDSSLLSLFWPVRKNLLIGLGLVNHVTLSEFKAILGHEFGHFSQRSMRLGSYVYVARQVVSEIVHGRDRWDDLLRTWRAQDIRIAIWGWMLYAVVWCVRKVMAAAFKGVALAHAALSRQMEFQADRVAVSIAGSDAIVHGLCKASFADQCMSQTLRDLTHASDHKLYTRDLFHHQELAAGFVRRLARDESLGVPPALPDDARASSLVFPEGAGVTPSMWSSHPPNAEREQNAKARYLRCALDDRPAWALFRDPKALREAVTARLFVPQDGRAIVLREPAEVQRFLDDEHEETTFDPRYQDMYEGRPVAPGNLDAAVAAYVSSPVHPDALREDHALLYGPDLAKVMDSTRELLKEMGRLGAVAGGEGSSAHFRGATVRRADATRALERVGAELEAKHKWLEALDQRIFRVHVQMAHAVDAEARDELVRRYRFQLFVQGATHALKDARSVAGDAVATLTSGRELDAHEVDQVFDALRRSHHALFSVLAESERTALPPMRNLEGETSLRRFLLAGELVSVVPLVNREHFDGAWIGAFFGQGDEVNDKLWRLHYKSLGGILALQERVAKEWLARNATDVAPS